MPTITLDVPTARYAEFLRYAATFFDDGLPATAVPSAGGAQASAAAGAWKVMSVPDEGDDSDLLIDYYRRLSPTAKKILDHLVDHPAGADADSLSFIIGLETKYALSGSVGHAAKVAGELGRECPIQIEKESGRYSVLPYLIDAIRQARLQSVRPPYVHRFVGPEGEEVARELDFPARYVFWVPGPDPEPRFFRDREELLEAEPEAFDQPTYAVTEFAPDHHSGDLIDRAGITGEWPVMGGE